VAPAKATTGPHGKREHILSRRDEDRPTPSWCRFDDASHDIVVSGDDDDQVHLGQHEDERSAEERVLQ